jgi:POT family proton-dependent oligopeptide transporter
MSWYHLFTSAVYFTPLLGALLSDILLGKYRTIMLLSLVYCLGHLALALDDTRLGLAIGLSLIAVGAGGIKPCVSAHVGDQFGRLNQHLLSRVFGWFYFAINLGSFVSTLLTPWLLAHYGAAWAFGVPGVLMALATWVFWLGRHKFVHIPPAGKRFIKETLSPEGLRALGRLAVLYIFVAVFWSLYDQTGSAWVLQAERMDRSFLGITWLSSQIQAINPLLILAFIPLFGRVVYPAVERVVKLTPLRKIGAGLLLAALSFWLSGWIEARLVAGDSVNIAWQLFSYVIITAGEILVSITCLEYSYTQAPRSMKSLLMAFYLVSVSAGNLFVSGVNLFIQNADGSSRLPGASYYWFFALLMLGVFGIYLLVSRHFKEQTYIQGEA